MTKFYLKDHKSRDEFAKSMRERKYDEPDQGGGMKLIKFIGVFFWTLWRIIRRQIKKER